MTLGKTMMAGVLASLLPAAGALADFDLQVTEIWPGNEPGDNLTEDWFELTNFGDMAWTAATDGNLWYDDESFDPVAADLMSGIASIAPGESVIYVNGSSLGALEWQEVWGPVVGSVQVGSFDGSGLGGGGDAVGVFLDSDMSGDVESGELILTGAYPFADANGGQSYDLVLSAFSTVGNASGAVATLLTNDESQPAIGSPGAIPEPASLALLGLGGLLLAGRRR